MRPIEEMVWPWVMNGFKGLTGMINHYLKDGLPPTDYLRTKLVVVRDEINAILERIK